MDIKGFHLTTFANRCRFINTMESDLYVGKNVDGDEVQVRLQKGVGIEIWTRHKEKPKWWEVVAFDELGFQVSVTYKPYEE